MPNTPITRLSAALLFFLLFLTAGTVFAQEAPEEEPVEQPFEVYSLGQQTLSISAGMFIPLFFQAFDGTIDSLRDEATGERKLKLGAAGSLQWGIHLSNNWMVGLEVGGMVAKSIQDNNLFQLPIMAKGSYIIHVFPFEFPIFLGTGLDIVRYSQQTHLNWIVKPGFSSIWKYDINWGFGLNVAYWWVLQPWPTEPDLGRMGNFLEVTLTAQYNF